MDKIYSDFAYIYDALMNDVDYTKWANYIQKIFKKNKLSPKLVLDLACGTGKFCEEFAARGYDMIGVDLSIDMLDVANKKNENKENKILFLNQDMTRFELFGTVDAIVCLLDSINYVLKKSDLLRQFKLVENYLNPGGLFIFDINTEYKFENILKDNVFYDIREDLTYIWTNHFNEKIRICELDVTFFVKENEVYKRYDEEHRERAYKQSEIIELLGAANLKIVGNYHDLSFSAPKNESERIFFVCRKNLVAKL